VSDTQHVIIVQTCAKIAAEILVHAPITDCEGTILQWKEYFHEVLDEVNKAIGSESVKSGRTIPVLKQEDMQMKLTEYTAKAGSAVTSDSINSEDVGLTGRPVKNIKRKSWGNDEEAVTVRGGMTPPAWLVRAAAKEGVTEVFDNRASKADNPKRPDFVSTGPDKKAFWAPKEER